MQDRRVAPPSGHGDLDHGDLYATLLADVAGADPDRVLDGWTGRFTGALT